jgi:class 3 adenylate cyclase
LPVPGPDATKNIVLAALDRADFVIQRKKEREDQGKLAFEMRTGIHTGNVIAGIVGVKKFQYDIWGIS